MEHTQTQEHTEHSFESIAFRSQTLLRFHLPTIFLVDKLPYSSYVVTYSFKFSNSLVITSSL